MKSIRHRLLVWLLSGLTLAVAAAGLRIYFQTLEEANALFDFHLKQMAASLPSDAFGPVPPPSLGARDLQDQLIVQIWDRTGVQLYFSRPGSNLPQRAELGFSTVITQQGRWRIYSAMERNNVVQVAQPMRLRQALAAGMALRSIVPLLLLLPVLAVLIWITVGSGLRPLNRIASALGERTPQSLPALEEGPMPIEVRPLVQALNDLLGRLARALESQRNFVADAAHELRTPLTAVQLQIQLAERAESEAERRAAFTDLKQGISRASHLVRQLLTLARQEPDAAQRPDVEVDLAEIARRVLSEQAPLAAERNIELGITGDDDVAVPVRGDGEALRVMLGNLVDNAIRYTPGGGAVDVSLRATQDRAEIIVADTGSGIPESDRERVFDRFYRRDGSETQGSGLGLAIVKNIADRHGAVIALDDAEPGLRVRVSFPRP
ncbi:MAG: two-component sensor histidine kinase [Betaproteobacteria bacterium RIFCSPLOWO2_02_FULL_63_19]|nr:MAG: two-component sensor histidine kinase [Betaproteobacteria bacterium RIFCSPLOWO2_02_FULL_63_19]